MAIININANLNGGDDTTPDNELFYRIYGDVDAYASPIHTTGTAIADADVTVTGDVVDISNIDGTTNTSFKIAAVDGEGNEGVLSDAFNYSTLLEDLVFSLDHNGTDFVNAVTETALTNNNTATLGASIASGTAPSVQLDGVDQYLSTPITPALQFGDTDVTVAVWVYSDTVSFSIPVGQWYTDGVDKRVWTMQWTDSDKSAFVASSNGIDTTSSASTASMTVQTPTLMWGLYNQGLGLLYVQINDESAEPIAHTGGFFTTDSDLTVGSTANPALFFNGRVSFEIWNRALNATERSAYYNSGNGVKYPFNGV